jgi:hypothetical protein
MAAARRGHVHILGSHRGKLQAVSGTWDSSHPKPAEVRRSNAWTAAVHTAKGRGPIAGRRARRYLAGQGRSRIEGTEGGTNRARRTASYWRRCRGVGASNCPDGESNCPDGESNCPDGGSNCPDEANKCPGGAHKYPYGANKSETGHKKSLLFFGSSHICVRRDLVPRQLPRKRLLNHQENGIHIPCMSERCIPVQCHPPTCILSRHHRILWAISQARRVPEMAKFCRSSTGWAAGISFLGEANSEGIRLESSTF